MPTIGINLPGSASTPKGLHSALSRFVQDGFDTVEISLDAFPLIIGGSIVSDYVTWLGDNLAQYPLRYSAHIGRGVDLRSEEQRDLALEVLFRSIEVCGELSLSPLTLHFEQESDSPDIERRFYDDHRSAVEYTKSKGVRLCIENIEVEKVEPVVQMVNSIDGLGMTFDVGHAFLASGYFGFEFLESLLAALPHISHLHMSGNTGVFEPLRTTNRPVYDSLPQGYRMAFGRGDIHVPPFWGAIPYDEVLRILSGYHGVYLCEYYSDKFLPFNGRVAENVRAKIEEIRGEV